MLEYKTQSIPTQALGGVNKDEYRGTLSVETADRALAPIGSAIQAAAKGGWTLQNIYCMPQRIIRKKSIGELLLGWIPILGRWLCPNINETRVGQNIELYVLTFVREV